MKEYEPYEKWENEEIFGDLMLQYCLPRHTHGYIFPIPFQVIKWSSYDYYDGDYYEKLSIENQWFKNNIEIEVILRGDILFDGVRHCFFQENDNGYMFYIHLNELAQCLLKLEELCKKYCDPNCYP